MPDTDLLRAMRAIPAIDKRGHRYRYLDSAGTPDTTAIGYRDRGREGYVSQVGADDCIAWEAAAPGLRGVAVAARGEIHVVTDLEHVTLDPAGAEVRRAALPPGIRSWWVDPASGSLLGWDNRSHLVLDETPALHEALGKAVVYDFTPAADGRSVHLRTADAWLDVTSAGVRDTRPCPRDGQDGALRTRVEDLLPLPDGGYVQVLRRSLNVGAPEGHFFGPDDGMLPGVISKPDEWPANYRSLRRVGPGGETVWESPYLKDGSPVAVSSRGDVYAVDNAPFLKGDHQVLRVGPDGKFEAVGQVRGEARVLAMDGEDLVVVQDAATTRVGPSGVREEAVPEGWRPTLTFLGPRRLVLDREGTHAALLGPGERLTPVTDTECDHSAGRAGEVLRLAATLPSRETAPIEIQDGWIVVGGVRVPRRPPPG